MDEVRSLIAMKTQKGCRAKEWKLLHPKNPYFIIEWLVNVSKKRRHILNVLKEHIKEPQRNLCHVNEKRVFCTLVHI